MSSFSRAATCGALCGILVLCGAARARADVTLERSFALEGVGAMAFGNMSGTQKTTISGDKLRTDSDLQMKSKLVRFLAHNAVGPTAEIIRLDDDRIYHLNINKKEYTESSFEQMRERLKSLSQQPEQRPQDEQQPSAIDESKCEWLPARVEVQRNGEKAQFAGYDAERVTIMAAQPCKDKETGSICEVALSLDEWLATGFAESAEVQKFYKAYATKMGIDESTSGEVLKRAQAMFSRYKGIWEQVAAKMQGVKGYPVKTAFALALGGEQCKNPNAKQAQADAGSAEGSGSSSSGGTSPPPTNPAALANAMAGKLGSLFHKKKDDASASAAQPSPGAGTSAVPLSPGDVAVMTITSQLLSVSTNGVSADLFTVPADFKKTATQ